MEKLVHIIQSLGKEEKDVIIKHYLLKNSFSKRLQLFNLILMEGVRCDKEAANRLYGAKPNAAFSQLKKRLKEDILNILLTNENSHYEEPKDFINAEAVAIKQVLFGKMLLNRGLTQEAIVALKKAFRLAKEHEAFEVQALAHSVLKAHCISSHLEGLDEAEEDFANNVDDFYQLMNFRLNKKLNRSNNHDLSLPSEEIIAIDRRRKSGRKNSGSFRVEFLSVNEEIDANIREKDYIGSLKIADRYLPVIDNIDHLITPSQKASFFLSLSKTHLGLAHFDKAISYGNRSSKLFQQFEEKKLDALITIFKSYFYSKDLVSAKNVLKDCEVANRALCEKASELPLYRAYHLFLEGDYRSSIKALNTFFKRSRLEISLMLNGRMLELLNLLEMKDYEWFDHKLDNFRKVVYYHTEMDTLDRFTIIYKTLTSLKKSCYSKEKLFANHHDQWIHKLSDKKSAHAWDPLGAELIPIHEWLAANQFLKAQT